MKTLKKFLKKHNACSDGFEFAKDMTLEQFLNTCERGDWILWLFKKTNPNDNRLRILVGAYCANTVRHLMKDKRSITAIDVAIKYGNNEATEKELDAAAADASAAFAASDAFGAVAAAFADVSAANAAAAAAAAADAAYIPAAYTADAAYIAAVYTAKAAYIAAAYVAAGDAADAKKQNQKLTADICKKYLPLEIWDQSKIN